MELKRIDYRHLNARQKENYNYQKVSAALADYGFVTMRLSDDWNGADFLALSTDGQVLKVQLKSRLTFDVKYQGKDLWICFPWSGHWYLYPHDVLLSSLLTGTSMGSSGSWINQGMYSMPRIAKKLSEMLQQYRITA